MARIGRESFQDLSKKLPFTSRLPLGKPTEDGVIADGFCEFEEAFQSNPRQPTSTFNCG
jgi:hypothetical protein